ncbi:hypothetical protein DDP54_17195 [Cellulomonas sp. WB94]|uniref:hypothetical protein n=1 Tax=Cellulomonas sp. WB94 TaxID=2173174 RepID=UPI000D582CE9|nr:hypothetical protein [Cellulomonas sp. WB94]PVU81096.1 hypothetical protein DDP54_17195 [Cellulomonas sp. WB94]
MRDTTRRSTPAAHAEVEVPELSLVVVHGIGSQSDGATARDWAQSAVEFLTRSGTPARITDVVPPGIGAPPAYTVEVNAPGVVAGLPVVRLQFVDAYWANAFPAPSIRKVVRWLFTLGPNLAVAQAVLSAHRDVQPLSPGGSQRTSTAATVVRRWGALTRILPVTFQLVSVALLAPVLAVIALALLVVTVLPIPGLRRAVAGGLGFLSAGIGDVTTALQDPTSLKAIRARVRWTIDHELARLGDPRRVHVLAHSQGGSIAYGVLAGMPPDRRPTRFTTVGAATGRLNDLRHLDPLPSWATAATTSSAVAALSILPLFGLHPALVLVPVAWICAIGALQWVYWSRRFAGDGAIPRLDPLIGVDWLDLWAPFDLVPNGRAVEQGVSGYRVTLVPGGMSVLHDHVSYASDLAETVPRVLAHASGALPRIRELAMRPGALAPGGAQLGARRGLRARPSLRDSGGTGTSWMPWEGRDWLSLVLRVVTWLGAATLVVAYRWTHLAAWGRWMRQVDAVDSVAVVVDRWLTWATGLFTSAGSHCCTSASPVAGAALVAVVAAVLAALAWRAIAAVQRRSLTRWLATGLVERSVIQLSGPLVAVVLAWIVLAVVAVVVLVGGPPGT